MVFSSFSFLFFFLPVLLVVYFSPLCRSRRIKNLVLLVFSLVFYSFGGWRLIPIIIVSILINYIFGRLADKDYNAKIRKIAVVSSVICNVAILFLFKYLGLITGTLNNFFPVIPIKELVLPIGISFYTFQGLSYTIDVFRGEARAEKNFFQLALYISMFPQLVAGPIEKNFFQLALYISMFPQLVAGPIVRYTTISKELRHRNETWENFEEGIYRFLFGLGKKVLLANTFGQVADSVFDERITQLSVCGAWLGVISYALQIYFDFSGYSDMAIGLGRIFGFHFLENFNYPYIARSIKDFWSRWHISLSTWFRDYLYIPLGGNRGSQWKKIRNLLIVWALTGFWHGAAWTYLVWGVYYAVLLIGEKYLWRRFLERLPRVIQHVYALFFILIGWLIFRAASVTQIGSLLAVLFGAAGTGIWDNQTTYFLLEFRWEFLFGILASLPIKHYIQNRISTQDYPRLNEFLLKWVKPAFAFLLGGLSVLSLVNTGYNPFIYFQF